MIPGTRLRALASRLCRTQTMERLIDPVLADLQAEYRHARHANGRSRLVLWRGYLSFWRAVGLHCLNAPLQPSPAGTNPSLTRVIAYPVIGFVVLTALLIAAPLQAFPWWGSAADRVGIVLTLVPQALPLTIPAGLCMGVACALRGRRPTAGRVLTVLALAAVATAMVWATLEWAVPAGNQRFRELVATRLGDGRPVHLEPGLNELGLSRLSQRTDPAARRHRRVLWALCFASGPLALFALGVAGRVRRFSAVITLSLGASIAYVFAVWAIDASLRDDMLHALGAWTPNVALVAAGVLLLRAAAPPLVSDPKTPTGA